jgi:uncharacterized protein (TIGR00369 family)
VPRSRTEPSASPGRVRQATGATAAIVVTVTAIDPPEQRTRMHDPSGPVPDLDAAGWKRRIGAGTFFDLVGPLWARREGDGWAYAFVADERHLNPQGIVHGGMLATLADHALSEIAWQDAGRRPCVTVALETHFMGAVSPGRFVEARGRVARRTRSMSFVQGGLWVDGTQVLAASAVMRLMGDA